jgi:hypothetical protein
VPFGGSNRRVIHYQWRLPGGCWKLLPVLAWVWHPLFCGRGYMLAAGRGLGSRASLSVWSACVGWPCLVGPCQQLQYSCLAAAAVCMHQPEQQSASGAPGADACGGRRWPFPRPQQRVRRQAAASHSCGSVACSGAALGGHAAVLVCWHACMGVGPGCAGAAPGSRQECHQMSLHQRDTWWRQQADELLQRCVCCERNAPSHGLARLPGPLGWAEGRVRRWCAPCGVCCVACAGYSQHGVGHTLQALGTPLEGRKEQQDSSSRP